MDLSIIIVTHNSRSPIGYCLGSLIDHAPRCSHEIIVIDNASTDGTPSVISDAFESVHLVVNRKNRGYSRGVNQGIKLSKGRMALILNPDIIVQNGSLERLIEFMNGTPDAGIIAAKLLYPDGRLQHSCRTFYTFKTLLLRRTFLGRLFPGALREHLMMDYDHEKARKVDWVTGACMLVRREAFERVGRMDERFFLYFEDVDWCFRMKNHGWAVYYVPEAVLVHRYERSSAKSMLKKPFVLHLLSLFRYYEKWDRVFYFFRRHRGSLVSLVFIVSDLAAVNISFVAAYYLRDLLQPLFRFSLYPLDWYMFFILFYNLIFFVTFLFNGLYRVRREAYWMEELVTVAKTVVLGAVILMASTYMSKVRIYSRAVVLGQAMIAVFLVAGFRQLVRAVHRELVKASFDLKRVLIVGREVEARELGSNLSASPELGIDFVGQVSDGPDSLGGKDDIAGIVEKFKIQEVMILPSFQEDESVKKFLLQSKGRVIKIRLVSPLARYLMGGVRVEEIAGTHAFSMERGISFLAWTAFKRTLDFSTGLVLLPFISFFSGVWWLYGNISRNIRFFSEIRIGAGGDRLIWPRILNAEGAEGSDFLKPRFCLLLLRGRLSLVGPPSPLPHWRLSGLAGEIGRVRPGITGRWRVHPGNDWEKAFVEEMLELRSWSFVRETIVLARSLGLMLRGLYPEWFHEERRNA